MLHVRDHHLAALNACSSAKQAWDTLERTYMAKSNARKLQLRMELSNLKMASGEPLAKYVARARQLRDDLAATGHIIPASDLVWSVLGGLPREYSTVVSVIEASSGEPELDAVMHILLRAEQRAGKHDSGSESAALASMQRRSSNAFRRGSGTGSGNRSGFGGRSQQGDRGSREARGDETRTCYLCGEPGHLKANCPKRTKDAGGKPTPLKQLALSAAGDSAAAAWVIDSGSKYHITPSKDKLIGYQPLETKVKIVFGNKQELPAVGTGDMIVNGPSGEVRLTNVHYVPGAYCNLFSVRQATEKGARVVFEGTSAYIMHGDNVVLEGAADGVYYMTAQPACDGAALAAGSGDTADLWHRRYGHLGFSNLARLVKEKMVTGINVAADAFEAAKHQVCEPCVLGKQHRLPFPEGHGSKPKALDLVHMDVCGPMPEPSLGGKRYAATFLDDATKLSLVVCLPFKSDVPATVKQVLALLERSGSGTVRAVRSDRGGEYVNKELGGWLKDKGIVHETTAPYTPEQNGAAERLNRTLMERVRAMLIDAGLPLDLWAEAVMTANFIRNRSPVSSGTATPWERFFGSKPDVSALRVFGATAYVHIPKALRTKLDPVSRKGVFIGYEPGAKAWRVLLDDGRKVVVSRDVTFDEAPRSRPSSSAGDVMPEPEAAVTSLGSGDDDGGELVAPASAGDAAELVAPTAGDAAAHAPDAQAAGAPAGDGADNGVAPRYPQRQRNKPGDWWVANKAPALSATTADDEPATLKAALDGPYAEMWRRAMDDEMASLHANKTWVLEELPTGAKAIPVKWVFKIKRDAAGNIERFKARLVAKGFMQVEGIDFNEVFAPVSKYSTLRAYLAEVAARDWEMHHMDVKTAFLNGELEEVIFMQQPPGYEVGGKACRLLKALYGLRQAPRAWHAKLHAELERLGFAAAAADPSLYVRRTGGHEVWLLVYVDDLLVASGNDKVLRAVKSALMGTFDTRDLGAATLFLGMELVRDRSARAITINQRRMTTELVNKYGLGDGKIKATPISLGTRLIRGDDDEVLDTAAFPYSELVGSLLYLSVCTRPDIAEAVGKLARYMAKPTAAHWGAAKGVLRYLAGTAEMGITFKGSEAPLVGYCDSDYAGDIDSRRSTTGYVFIVHGGAVSWNSKLQATVAVSTTEAEYMAAAGAVKEALWLRKLMGDFGIPIKTVKIYGDNQGAIKLLKHPIASARSKHIDVIYHFARERVARGEVTFEYISTERMVADGMTKALPENKFVFCRESMGVWA